MLIEAVSDTCSKVMGLETEKVELEKENEALLETLKESESGSNKIDNGGDEVVSVLKEKVSFVAFI